MVTQLLVPAAISIAAEFFPALATKLGGPRGRELAEQVIDVAASVAGTPRDATPQEIIAALKSDSSRATETRLRLEELDAAAHQRIIEDRMDARRYQSGLDDTGRLRGNLMLLGVVIGLVACIIAVMSGGIDPSRNAGALALLTTIAGALLKMLSDAFAFEFGSSSGSKAKTAHIENIQTALVQAASESARRAETARQRPVVEATAADDVTINTGSGTVSGSGGGGASEGGPSRVTIHRSSSPQPRDFVAELRMGVV